jgi:glycosyltransferase involved in cell wall biosynthesis
VIAAESGVERHRPRPIIAAFVLEQTLGHVTHAANLRKLVSSTEDFQPVFVPVPFDMAGRRLPVWSNWTIRAGVRAALGLRRLRRAEPPVVPDVMFVHTQVPAVLLGGRMRRTPTVVSLDATPLQYDQLGEFYAHDRAPAFVERLKHRANRRCFARARQLVTWSEWAKQGLADGYGIHPTKVSVVAPGVDIDLWRRPEQKASAERTSVGILFVGGDLRRKGGDLLVRAVRRLRSEADLPEVELHLVTPADIEDEPGIFVHPGLAPNSPELIEQYHAADIFALPTLGDCLPMVLAEAAAAGLPIVATDVGAIAELVRPGETGELVAPGDLESLTDSLRRLVLDAELRHRYGTAASHLAERDHNARVNAARIVDMLVEASAGQLRGSDKA